MNTQVPDQAPEAPVAYIVAARRTPTGKYGGALSSIRPDDLAATVIKAVMDDSGVPPEAVDEVIFGNANGAGEENRNVARMAWLLNDYPNTVPGMTINRLCASGMSSIATAATLVKAGEADIVVAGGVESMSRAPWVMEKPSTAFSKPGEIFDTSIGWRFVNKKFKEQEKTTFSMPETAEEVARVKDVSREDCDAFALRSHQLAHEATKAGKFEKEIVPISVPQRKGDPVVVTEDEGIRPNTTAEALAKLRAVVGGGSVVTAGNASSLNDGASAVLICSAAAVEKYGLKPLAKVVGAAAAGLAPEIMGLGPVPATQKLFARIGWSNEDLDAVELNEAFASQSLASVRDLGLDPEIVNAWGGAIALGHPLGSSGCRITVTLLSRLLEKAAETGKPAKGLASMCIGVGQGQSLAIETV
ncbi:acetyl-CoA C-acyltransferase [Corynebacterium kozikiae]|uniref:acetyl-CoA C-acyltransferase n=1 Tax=Corynebacterium kozikiae TaxID=2968469 RepID=UPI00211C88A7|nr:acetyl-CoA C-acyltransferase [Corynebacterium sp. 76QC2CO]MCQ9343022.1 acetyl-CoA C-acyltransferase [Corynebacterium sp. 76QC2CO]